MTDLLEIPPIESAEAFEARVAATFAPRFKSKFGGRLVHEFVGEKPRRDWIVKGALLGGTFSLIVGEPGCGKSFLSLDLAMTCALAVVDEKAPKEWFGRRIKPCGVVYIAAEGQEDFIIRMHAWLRAKGLPIDTKLPMYLIPSAVDLRSSDTDTKELVAEIAWVESVFQRDYGCATGMIFVDTFNRALAGGDDTKAEHVGAMIKHCGVIREATKAAVIAVHHTAKNTGKTDPRGHGSIRGDNDGEIFVFPAREGAPNEWRITRNKAGPTGDRHEFRLRPFEVGRDDDDDPITSCYVAHGATEASIEGAEMRDAALAAKTGKPTMTADGRSILPGNLTIVMRALHDLIERDGVEAPPDVRAPHGRKTATMKRWLEEIGRAMPGDDKEDAKFKDRCRKARDAAAITLRNRGIIGMDGDHVWRTSKRIAMVDLPEKQERTPKLPQGVSPAELENTTF